MRCAWSLVILRKVLAGRQKPVVALMVAAQVAVAWQTPLTASIAVFARSLAGAFALGLAALPACCRDFHDAFRSRREGEKSSDSFSSRPACCLAVLTGSRVDRHADADKAMMIQGAGLQPRGISEIAVTDWLISRNVDLDVSWHHVEEDCIVAYPGQRRFESPWGLGYNWNCV